MATWIETLIVLWVLTDLVLLGSSRIPGLIRVIGLQGLLLGILTMALHPRWDDPRVLSLAIGATLIKGLVVPWLLRRAVREARVRTTVEPYVGYSASLAIGALLLPLSLYLGARLPLPHGAAPGLVVPAALFTCMVGFLILVSRRKALTQVIGYLVLENGIYGFGVGAGPQLPPALELGVLLDLVGAVFIMGITVLQISRTVDHLDTAHLADLRD